MVVIAGMVIDVNKRSLSVPVSFGHDELSISRLQFSSIGLYGRDREAAELQKVYEGIRQRHMDELKFRREFRRSNNGCSSESGSRFSSPSVTTMALIAGSSGTGKTALSKNLERYVRRTGGLSTSGKFDMTKQSEPYTAITAALNKLCDSVLLVSNNPNQDSSVLQIQSAVRENIASESAMLFDIAPNLSHFFARPEPVIEDGANSDAGRVENRNQFNHLIRRLLRSFYSTKPLVLFLEDLQWADTASLELIDALSLDRENSGLLVVGTYRDNEVEDPNHPLRKCLHKIEERGRVISNTKPIETITLGTLDVDAINKLLADLLSSTVEETESLAEIVYRKTHGNAFAVIQYLQALQDEGLLQFSLGTLGWKWDNDEIQSCSSITENVVDMMVCKIKKTLSADTREVLQMAACLGGTFDLSMLSVVVQNVKSMKKTMEKGTASLRQSSGNFLRKQGQTVFACLEDCVREGLLEIGEDLQYNFVHDQILAAALSLIPEEGIDSIKFQIGKALLENLTEAQVEKHLFVIARLLNHKINMPSAKEHNNDLQLSRLNLQAGRKAMSSSAFGPAEVYIDNGIKLLGPNNWRDQPELSLALFSSAAKIALCNGCLHKMKSCFDEVVKQDLPIRQSADLYCMQITSMTFQKPKLHDAMNISLNVLSQLGVTFPKRHIKVRLTKDYLKTNRMLKGIVVHELSDLPFMEDRDRRLKMQMMEKLAEVTFYSKAALYPLVALKMLRWSLRYGISKFSVSAFLSYGLLLCSDKQSFTEGNDFATTSVATLERLKANEFEAKTKFMKNALISHWAVPAHLSQKSFFQHYKQGIQNGEIQFAFLSLRHYCQMALFAGQPLSFINAEIEFGVEHMKEYSQEKSIAVLLPTKQFVLNLIGSSDNPAVLSGEAMQLEQLLGLSKKNNNHLLKGIINFYQLWAAYLFEDLELAAGLLYEVKDIAKTNRSAPIVWRCGIIEGLTAFALARSTKLKKWRVHGANVISKIRRWVNNGCVNCKHGLLLLEAESAALKGDDKTTRQKFKDVISMTSRCGLIHDRALANERLGEYLLEKEDRYFSSYHLSLAYRLYTRWGANAKADRLNEKYKNILDEADQLTDDDNHRRWSL